MSISSALSNALSGLTANSRQAQVVSANLANALTPGYAPRALELSALGEMRGGGVAVLGVRREEDAGLLSDRRMADSDLARARVRAGFVADLERVVGTPDTPGSLSQRVFAFEASLVTAAAKPEEQSRLQAAVQGAVDLARALGDISDRVQQSRAGAEAQIGQAVADVNTYLGQIHALNVRIVDAANAGHPTASFEDQRRVVLDRLAELVPVRLAPREGGAVAVYTPAGAALLSRRSLPSLPSTSSCPT